MFPNNSQMISRNLLTSEAQLDGAGLRAHDRAVLAIVTAWQQDPTFEAVRAHLDTMTRRLREFTEGAAGAGNPQSDSPPAPSRPSP